MSKLYAFPRINRQQLSQMRSRDLVLRLLVPQLLRLIWDRGDRDPRGVHGPPSVRLKGDLVIGGFIINSPSRFGPHVYTGLEASTRKVFSIHCADPAFVSSGLEYVDGHCTVLSWRRGEWEDELMKERTEPRSIAHVVTAGLSRRKVDRAS